jgi:hypothetical protein
MIVNTGSENPDGNATAAQTGTVAFLPSHPDSTTCPELINGAGPFGKGEDMRWPRLVLVAVLCSSGCTHMSLERNTLNQIGTLSELRAQEVMNNAAAIAVNPSALPFFSVIRAGSAQVEDTGRIDSRSLWRG